MNFLFFISTNPKFMDFLNKEKVVIVTCPFHVISICLFLTFPTKSGGTKHWQLRLGALSAAQRRYPTNWRSGAEARGIPCPEGQLRRGVPAFSAWTPGSSRECQAAINRNGWEEHQALRLGVVTERSYPHVEACGVAGRSHLMPEARGCVQEEQSHFLEELWSCVGEEA